MLLITKFIFRPLVLFIMLYFPLEIFSQDWPMPGAVWRYCVTDWTSHPAGYMELAYDSDTMIDGREYNIIRYSGSSKQPGQLNYDSLILFTRYSNDTVYRWVNDQDYLFFSYNGLPGDVYTTFRTAGWGLNWSDSACTSALPLKVIDTSTIMYEGQMLRRLVLRDTLFMHLYPTANEPVDYFLLERIGITNYFPLINNQEPAGECFLPTDWSTVGLGTYSDSSFGHLFYECEGVGTKEIIEQSLNCIVYPNPADAEMKILVNGQAVQNEIRIISLTGQIVYSRPEAANSHNISILAGGLYVVEVSIDDQLLRQKLLVRH